MKKKSLGINALLNGLRSALNLIFPLITFPYVARVLSVEGIGIYNFSNIYVNYFVLLAGLGIATYAVREGAKYRDDKRKISTFSSEIFSINIISTIIAYLLLIISLIVFKNLHNYVSTILIFSLQILFTTIGTEWIYTIYEDYSYITVRSIIFKVFSIILLFIFVRKPNDYVWYAGITVFSSVGSNILNFVHARSFIEIHFVKSINVKRHLKPILIIFASTVAVTLYVSSDTTILGLLKNDYAVGIYSVAVKIYTLTNGLLGGLLIVTVPRLAMLLGNKRMKDYTILLSQVINMITILIFPIATGLIMLSKEVILIIAGEKYLNSIFSLQIIAMALGFSIFSSIFDQCVLIPAKRERFVLRNTLITGVANVLLNFIMIPLISYDGAALTTVMSEAIVMSLNLRSARDIVGPIIFSKDNVKNVFSSLIGCLGIVLVCSLCKLEMHSLILCIIVSVILSIIVYGIILIFCGNEIALFYLKKIKNRKNKLL
ncbi:flippase [Limosilactobacillus reuteri]|uniref:flippase n=1 Tax=Limosilactobacillus reuteri TaxID=1598 RepID=UPI002360CCFD|nr:flippase [Limosilactobacillus reuteri]MDD1380277.1 flippase [Limosilactobacillus reuteri]